MKSSVDIYLAEPRGFCAGVVRAINIVEDTLQKYGSPIYVRHEIVHNKHVIKHFEQKGVIFVQELDEVQNGRPVILSAHGVGLDIIKKAKQMKLNTIDATCPLVKRVHHQVKKLDNSNAEIIIIGKKEHPEVVGTIGQISKNKNFHIITSIEQAKELPIREDAEVGFVTQTTLSVDETKDIIDFLKSKFKNLQGLRNNDICYATTNRQKAVKEMVKHAPFIIILGSKNSSNSKQLREVAMKSGAKDSILVDDASEINWEQIKGYPAVGISAGASAPEHLVEDLLKHFSLHYNKINIHDVIICKEAVNFKG